MVVRYFLCFRAPTEIITREKNADIHICIYIFEKKGKARTVCLIYAKGLLVHNCNMENGKMECAIYK